MKYLTFEEIKGGYRVLFVKHLVGTLVREADGDHYLLQTGSRGLLPDYILREIVEKMEELNKGRL